jgi:hypothetical protein
VALRRRNRYPSIINPGIIPTYLLTRWFSKYSKNQFWNIITFFKNMKAPKNHQFFAGSFKKPAGS